MIKIHLGLPAIFPEFLLHLSGNDGFTNVCKTQLISRDLWENVIHTAIELDPQTQMEANRNVMRLDSSESTAISHHNYLGNARSFFKSPNPAPLLEKKVGRITEFFQGYDYEIHLLIMHQADYFKLILGSSEAENLRPDRLNWPSWSQITNRIKSAAKNARLVVWDLEQPDLFLDAFWGELLSNDCLVAERILSSAVQERLVALQHKLSCEESIKIDESTLMKLDLLYSSDLELIGEQAGVSLISVS